MDIGPDAHRQQREAEQRQHDRHRLDRAERPLELGRHEDGGEGEQNAPAEEDVADAVDVQPHDEGSVGHQGEEAEVVKACREPEHDQRPVPHRLERIQQGSRQLFLGVSRRLRRFRLRHEDRQRDESENHQGRDAEERSSPGDRAELAAEDRADGDAEADGGFIQDDGFGDAAAGERHDRRQRRGDEQRIAEAPAPAVPDQLPNSIGKSAESGENGDDDDAEQQRPLHAEPGSDRAGNQHGDGHDGVIAGEQQADLTWRRIQLFGNGRQDGIHQTDPHEGDDSGKKNGPYGARLIQNAAARGGQFRLCSLLSSIGHEGSLLFDFVSDLGFLDLALQLDEFRPDLHDPGDLLIHHLQLLLHGLLHIANDGALAFGILHLPDAVPQLAQLFPDRDIFLKLLQREAERIACVDDLLQPLDIGFGVETEASPAAFRSQQPDLLVIAHRTLSQAAQVGDIFDLVDFYPFPLYCL
ncbi:hypothetical protein BN871_AG_00160 [Paenibacillus sp. P22]|nr:hypothetical protein BN871_AG_00160 [Paenibacillus sp. P22]